MDTEPDPAVDPVAAPPATKGPATARRGHGWTGDGGGAQRQGWSTGEAGDGLTDSCGKVGGVRGGGCWGGRALWQRGRVALSTPMGIVAESTCLADRHVSDRWRARAGNLLIVRLPWAQHGVTAHAPTHRTRPSQGGSGPAKWQTGTQAGGGTGGEGRGVCARDGRMGRPRGTQGAPSVCTGCASGPTTRTRVGGPLPHWEQHQL